MGLDLIHAKLSRKDDDTYEYFTLEELKDLPLIAERHWDLITHVVEMECRFTIYILPDEQRKSAHDIDWQERNGNVRFLVRGVDNIAEEIMHLERKYNLSGMHQFNHAIGAMKDETSIEYAESYEMVPVIYWKNIGHQRKGMKPAFYEAFENCKVYCQKEDVIRAATYLIEKGTFQEDFIDNFIEGDSVFFSSW